MISNILSSLQNNFSQFSIITNKINNITISKSENPNTIDNNINNDSNIINYITQSLVIKNLVKSDLNVIKTYDEVLGFIIDIKK